MKKTFIAFLLLISLALNAEVLIITHSYNRPDFIDIQCRTFKKFLKDTYRFVVFNDATDPELNGKINDVCKLYGIDCVEIPQEIHTRPYHKREPGDPLNRPNIRHCNCIQYSLDTLGFNHNGPVAIVDSDIFLIRPISIEALLREVDIVAPIRGAENKVFYLWPGLCFLAMDRLPEKETMNFNCGMVNNAIVDSGGHTYTYLINHPEVTFKNAIEYWAYQLFCPDRFVPDHMIDTTTPVEIQIQRLSQMGFNEREIAFLQKKPHSINFALDNHFLHYRAGTNYDNQSKEFDERKSRLINDFINEILEE